MISILRDRSSPRFPSLSDLLLSVKINQKDERRFAFVRSRLFQELLFEFRLADGAGIAPRFPAGSAAAQSNGLFFPGKRGVPKVGGTFFVFLPFQVNCKHYDYPTFLFPGKRGRKWENWVFAAGPLKGLVTVRPREKRGETRINKPLFHTHTRKRNSQNFSLLY